MVNKAAGLRMLLASKITFVLMSQHVLKFDLKHHFRRSTSLSRNIKLCSTIKMAATIFLVFEAEEFQVFVISFCLFA
jgi:hypothetical protein